MNLREMRLLARSLVRDNVILDAHFNRWVNTAYRDISRTFIVPRLHSGDGIALEQVSGSTDKYYLPYDFERVISFYDSNGRSLDPIPSEDVQQFGEYNSFGSFVQFYEHNSNAGTALYSSVASGTTVSLTVGSTAVSVSAAVLTSAHEDEFLLPLASGTAAVPNPENYAYKITSIDSTSTATLETPFRGATQDSGANVNITANYFEIRPQNTPILSIKGNPGSSTTYTIYVKYQRKPKKLASDSDIPEDDRLAEAIVHKAISLAGMSYRSDFDVKASNANIAASLAGYQTSKDFDKMLIHNYVQGNPNVRTYGQGLGTRHMGMYSSYSGSSIQY